MEIRNPPKERDVALQNEAAQLSRRRRRVSGPQNNLDYRGEHFIASIVRMDINVERPFERCVFQGSRDRRPERRGRTGGASRSWCELRTGKRKVPGFQTGVFVVLLRILRVLVVFCVLSKSGGLRVCRSSCTRSSRLSRGPRIRWWWRKCARWRQRRRRHVSFWRFFKG